MIKNKKYGFFGVDAFGTTKESRLNPKIYQCWYLHLNYIVYLLKQWVLTLEDGPNSKVLLDVGSGDNPPYDDLFKNKVSKILKLDPFSKIANIKSEVENITLPDESVDLILSTQVFEHVKNPFLASNEIFRVLKPGGQAFISTHGFWEIHRIPKDYWRFMPDGLNEIFNKFSHIEIIPNGGTVVFLGQAFNLLSREAFKGILKPILLIYWLIINIISLVLSKIFKNNSKISINYVVLLKK